MLRRSPAIAAECKIIFNPQRRIDVKAFQWITFLMDSGSNVILFHKLLQGIKLHAGDIQIATASAQGFINVTQKAALPLQSEMGTEIEFTYS